MYVNDILSENYYKEYNDIIDNNMILEDALIVYEEVMSDIDLFIEGKKYSMANDSLFTKIKKFFTMLISSITTFIKQIKADVERRINMADIKNNLKKAHKKLLTMDKNSKVEVSDIWSLKNDYLSLVKELSSYSKRIGKNEYKYTEDMDRDIEIFNTIVSDYESKLKKDEERTVKVRADELIRFIEDELTGRSSIMASLNTNMQIVSDMKINCESLMMKRELLGPDVLTKKLTILQKLAKSITKVFQKWVAKIIATFIILFS